MEEVQVVLNFLRKNGYKEAEFALKEDLTELSNANGGSFSYDFDKFVFPMMPPPPPVKVPAPRLRRRGDVAGTGSGTRSGLDESEDEEFKSVESSTSATVTASADVCSSSDFANPYGLRSATQTGSDTSSDRMSQFGTARDYQEFVMQTDLWYDDKDDGLYMTPSFGGVDPFGCPTEDKFIMTSVMGNLSRSPFCFNRLSGESEGSDHRLDYPFQIHNISVDNADRGRVKDCYQLDENIYSKVGVKWDLGRTGNNDGEDVDSNLKAAIRSELEAKITKQRLFDALPDVMGNAKNLAEDLDGSESVHEADKEGLLVVNCYEYDFAADDDQEVLKSYEEPGTAVNEQEVTPEEIPYWKTNGDEYEVFELRIIHRKNRTGFEESKEFPIVLHAVIARRYYVTEYLGSAAFSKVVQAHDTQTGVDVCLKIIKNDKDFFDQSLDEIKLLKFVNKHDPTDKHHILRLYDYFYHQEHLFIVCELLRANLYEFQKYNLESGGEPYFTMGRLQAIARQCLEALDFLHGLGIIHCDLKPENVLIKSYSRCEIKVIDLGSSRFQTDNLCLYVQSRSYRAPEVILGLPYNPKIDIWSLGCIMAELCSGEVLSPNDDVVLLLARMIGVIGPIDLEMLLRGQETHKYFTKEYDLFHLNEDTNQIEFIIPEQSSLEQHLSVSDAGFLDFLRSLLQINPRARPTAKQALEHPWLSFPY